MLWRKVPLKVCGRAGVLRDIIIPLALLLHAQSRASAVFLLTTLESRHVSYAKLAHLQRR